MNNSLVVSIKEVFSSLLNLILIGVKALLALVAKIK